MHKYNNYKNKQIKRIENWKNRKLNNKTKYNNYKYRYNN